MNDKMKKISLTLSLIIGLPFLLGCSLAWDLAHTGAGKAAQVEDINFFDDTSKFTSNKDSGADLPDLFYISPRAILINYKKIIINDFTSITSDVGNISGLQIPEFKNIRKDIPDNIAQSFDGSIFPQCIRIKERIDYKDMNNIRNAQADAILFGNISGIKSGLRMESGGIPGLTGVQVEIKLIDKTTGEELIRMINRSTTDGDKVLLPIIRRLANLMNKAKKDVTVEDATPMTNVDFKPARALNQTNTVPPPPPSSPSASLEPPPAKQAVAYLQIRSRCNLRSEANAKSKIICTLKKGERVESTGKSGQWFNVKRSSGETGWVFQDLVMEDK